MEQSRKDEDQKLPNRRVERLRRVLRLRKKPDLHADMRFGKGWYKRNFLSEVLLPSLFTPRHGSPKRVEFPKLSGNQICVTWIGHASFLIQTREHNLVIDPIWANWLKVIKRLKHPGIELHDLPQIDLVLVSHAHFDHLDKKTLRAIADKQPIVVPEHVGSLVHGLGFNMVREMRRWEVFDYRGLRITLTPAQHWGARVLHDSHRSFGGFLIEWEGKTVFHAGDTAYFSGFKEIGQRFSIDLALLPIGAYDNLSRRDVHMNPEQALQAFVELRAQTLIPMHYGTFRLSYESLEEPPERLLRAAEALGLSPRVQVLVEGEPRIF
jgi:L-ascorbate metabolism protein UlaG (beta-lactamase superfamily)